MEMQLAFRSVLFLLTLCCVVSLREHRSWSTRHPCEMSRFANWPFAYEKYIGQEYDKKGRTNSNQQDFRHECQIRGGRSKCHICEEIECAAEGGLCQLQLQGVDNRNMSRNIPVLSDTAWPVGGRHRKDYGNSSTTHMCVFTSGAHCVHPYTTDFTGCTVRCFGYGFPTPPVPRPVADRTIVDFYENQPRWDNDGKVDLWEYPKTCAEATAAGKECVVEDRTPSFNPQGFTFTLAGSGFPGFKDGFGEEARFRSPEDVAVDQYGTIYVADTENHAIRMITSAGDVTTLAGKGAAHPGYQDGACTDATFTKPKGIDVRWDLIDAVETLIAVIADTGNHRIRRLEYVPSTGECTVRCFTGLCGNDTLSKTDFEYKATPYAGYADGTGLEARFSAPEGIAFMDDGFMVVADTGNWLIRWVADNGTTATLAGEIGHGPSDENGNPVGGCPPPCLVGVPGFRDGNLSYAQFYSPVAVARGVNNSVLVADEHRIRLIELPHVMTSIYNIRSEGRVSTLAGNTLQGYDDGKGQDATFFNPGGVFATADNLIYVVDTATCRIRRVTPMPIVAPTISCSITAKELVRPSGCISYDQPFDKIGRKITSIEANMMYNYGDPYNKRDTDRGKYMKNCVGVPPIETLDKTYWDVTGDNLVIDDGRTFINEDSEQGTAVIVHCPRNCGADDAAVEGDQWYSDDSSVCRAAIHKGVIDSDIGGYIIVTYQRMAYIWDANANVSATRNGVTSTFFHPDEERVFTMEPTNISTVMVHSISGHPAAHLESGCGFADAQPAQAAYFDKPHGIATYIDNVINNSTFLYIADTNNHRIRGLSAVCSQICENGGVCVASDTCLCPDGWDGIDCTIPTCSSACGENRVCTSPDTCTCKPGYGGANCDEPQCIQQCRNDGVCVAPDTCQCANGWFDTNCTTPVCTRTCANGGNCTAPNECACPSDWTGADCRIPVCEQTCLNGGYCVAPNTCICPPQYTNYDCSVPVCHQGYFKPNPSQYPNHLYASNLLHWETYKPCNLVIWCNSTEEFECYQEDMERLVIELPSGGSWRKITGRKNRPTRCMQIELPESFALPFELLYSDNTTTPVLRYSPNAKYTNNPLNPWRGYEEPTAGHTGPWTYETDRQIAYVQWLNVSQGVYVCANGGNCTEPDVCECAEGWTGFDCRTPICNQGYYFPEQETYVSGLETDDELEHFLPFMGENPHRLDWPYSNPTYTMVWEFYVNESYIHRETRTHGGIRYLGPANWSTLVRQETQQGGFRCSVRAMTQWENRDYILSHPNYYSRYMNPKVEQNGVQYTFWEGMEWKPVHQKSHVFYTVIDDTTYIYTNEGYRLEGVWNRTGNVWEYGTCIMEFDRNCTDPSKDYDLVSDLFDILVQDTDLSYRPRVQYNNARVKAKGRWVAEGGECVNHVVRGCFNNGTCVAPNVCQCAEGWTGYDCTVPICDTPCKHNGNCTLPNVCTCERGWEGSDCSIPICAQECQNGGYCIAPDTCKCLQWPNEQRDGREGGGRPLFRKPNGDPQDTGWTGYDCSVPICVQAERFLFNTAQSSPSYTTLGGHGGDNLLQCVENGLDLPRCPIYDLTVTSNDGKTFQTGCGFDEWYTGCCYALPEDTYDCYKCLATNVDASEHTYYCKIPPVVITGKGSEDEKFKDFRDDDNNFRLCGKYHSPRQSGRAVYYRDKDPLYSSYNYLSNRTSDLYLCNVQQWIQGDFIDDAGLGDMEGIGTLYGLKKGRHVRVNYANMIGTKGEEGWELGPESPGEGIYACYNRGSCLGPDLCSCTDGYEGDDCATPLCRHLQPSGVVTGCLNSGVCVDRDHCDCVQTESVLWMAHEGASRGITGWTGSDCSIPMCVQGFFDPFCTDLPQAPAGEGCYRCANGGNCTAPEICTCAEGWTGFDCRTPTCEVVADPLTRTQLGTIFEEKVISFESDPCAGEAIFGTMTFDDREYTRGNCTLPNQCTCLCKSAYDPTVCDDTGTHCDGAWQDNMFEIRDLLSARGPEFIFGTTDCYDGFEGNIDSLDRFVTCHHQIYVPNDLERDSFTIIVTVAVLGLLAFFFYVFARRRLQKRYLLAKIERRRSKRSSEESLLQAGSGAFGHK